MLNYVLEVNICWFVFYLLYSLVLSKETFFEYNRWYLLAGLLGGLLLPLVEYQIIIEQIVEIPAMEIDLEDLAGMTATPVGEEDLSLREMLIRGLYGIYLLGVAILAVRFIAGLLRIAWLYWRGTKMERPGYALVKTASIHPTFSFFHWLFQSQRIPLEEADEEKIIIHEIEHIRQWHSLDVLLIEIIGIILWFSPLVWLYRRSLRMIHEYQADEAVLQTTKRKSYGHLLIRQSLSGPPIAIANHFIHSQLKKRLTMMTRKKSTQRSLMKYTFILPILAVLLMAFAPTKVYKMVPVEVPTSVERNPGPDLDKIKKDLAAILAKRAYAKTNIDGELAGSFAKTYDKYLRAYPAYKKEITSVAVQVAAKYDMDTTVENDQMISGQFREPFKAKDHVTIIENVGPDGTNSTIRIRDKGNLDPIYIIDGKPSTKQEVEALNTNSIETVNVLKGSSAEEVYGSKGANGVIEIRTKEGKAIQQKTEIKGKKSGILFKVTGDQIETVENIDASAPVQEVKGTVIRTVEEEANEPAKPSIRLGTSSGSPQPLFVVDDEILEREEGPLNQLDPNDIESINVLKGEAAEKKYGTDGANGVVEIYTKGYKKQTQADEMPRFAGCEDLASADQKRACSKKLLMNYIITNMKYPKAAKEAGAQGKVVISFVVKKSGKLAQVQVAGGAQDAQLQNEALRIVKAMPDWVPGTANGKAVDVEMKLPINFSLNNKERAHQVVDQMPLFPGINPSEGTAAERKQLSDRSMLEFIYQNLQYPKTAKEAGTQGTVLLSFTVTKEGEMEDLRVEKAPSPELGKAAYGALNKLEGTWTPGKNDGQAVATELTIPIKFKMDPKQQAETPSTKFSTPTAALTLDNFQLTPNPNNGEMLVNFQASASPVLIQVFDVNGQEVYKEYLPNFAGSYRETIRLDKVAKGSHVLSIIQDKKRFTTKFVTQ